MVVISYSKIRLFIDKHNQASDSFNNWYRTMRMADAGNYHQIKDVFNSVDSIGNDRYVFNVGGNNYRVIALIFFDVRTVFIRFIGTHAEYDKLKDASLI